MDDRTLALKLVLQHLGVGERIDTVDERMEVQKAIYLAQSSGLSLGFSYGWYLKGPYSPSLTKVYYSLENLTPDDQTRLAGTNLRAPVISILDKIKFLMDQKPADIDRPRWLELLASLHYLIHASGFSVTKARERISLVKDYLAPNISAGVKALRANGLLG